MKDIVIISNFATEDNEHGQCRFHSLAKMMSEYAKVELIYSSFYHAGKRQRSEKLSFKPYKRKRIYEIGYKKNISLIRFISHFLWGFEVLSYLKQRNKPDAIYCAIPSLTVNVLVSGFCKKNNIKYVVDIQDLWPEAFEMVLPVHGLFWPIRVIANTIYKRADLMVAVSETYIKRAKRVNSSVKSVAAFLGLHFPQEEKKRTEEHSDIRIAYIGTIGASYDIKVMLDAIKICSCRHSNISCILMGDGADLEAMKKYAADNDIRAEFVGRLNYDEMIKRLMECDIAVNPIKKGSAGSVINKVGDYALAGLPVVNSQECEEYRELLSRYHAGFNCNTGDSVDMSEKISELVDNAELRKTLGNNNRRLGETYFNRNVTYPNIIKAVLEVIG